MEKLNQQNLLSKIDKMFYYLYCNLSLKVTTKLVYKSFFQPHKYCLYSIIYNRESIVIISIVNLEIFINYVLNSPKKRFLYYLIQ